MSVYQRLASSEEWKKVEEIENGQAVLASIELKRKEIERMALYNQNHDDIHFLACQMYHELMSFKLYLKRVRDIQEEIAREVIQRKEMIKNV